MGFKIVRTRKRPKESKPGNVLLAMAVAVLLFVAAYCAWCWFAKIRWGVEPPPEGVSLAVLGGAGGQLVAGSGIQIGKYFKKVVEPPKARATKKKSEDAGE